MDFVKMEGLGNDFIVVDGPVELEPERVVAWCRRNSGVGADGVLIVTPLSRDRIGMRYFNADGGEVEMCGNGLRCVARLARRREWVGSDRFVVESAVGEHPVEIIDDRDVRAFVGVPQRFRTGTLSVAGQEVTPIGVGNPHAVLFVEHVEEAPVDELGPRIEHDPLFPGRTNVEFVEVVDDETIRVRVWERGVGETLASGTCAAAAAFAANGREFVGERVSVQLRGGNLLIELDEAGAWMTGPGTVVFTGSVD